MSSEVKIVVRPYKRKSESYLLSWEGSILQEQAVMLIKAFKASIEGSCYVRVEQGDFCYSLVER